MKRDLSSGNAKTSACYTAPLAPMSALFGRRFSLVIASLLLTLNVLAQEVPNPFTTPAARLVNELMNRAGSPGYVTLAVENRSSLSPAEVTSARKAIEAQLRISNARLVKPERAVSEITVTISENLQGMLWIAEVKQGLTVQTVMVQSEKLTASTVPRTPGLTIRRTMLFTQEDGTQIVDFAMPDAKTLLVVGPARLTVYSQENARWLARTSYPISHSRPWPRDLRGHVMLSAGKIDVFLPAVHCSAAFSPKDGMSGFQCVDSDDPWPVAETSTMGFYSARQNHYTGVISGSDQSIPPFYSAAAVGDTNAARIFAGTDGRARIYGLLTQAPHVFAGWGSDIAAIHSGCGSGWQVLVSRAGDRSQPDAVEAMEIVNRDATPASAALELSGTITAMWRASDETRVNIVTQDLVSGKYEASILNIDCGH